MSYQLPALPYAYDALEPYIDAMTMKIHYTKHHQIYVNNLNKAVEGHPQLQGRDLGQVLKDLDALPEDVKMAIRNQGGGVYNHSMFWPLMKKDGGGQPCGTLADAIKSTFQDFAAFQASFNAAAKGVFGSGWAWLCLNPDGKLVVTSTANQDNPLSYGYRPIIGLDVWEHAYYLKYQNRRPDYISAWWHVVNWEQAEDNYLSL